MERKLASVQRVVSIEPIAGAELIGPRIQKNKYALKAPAFYVFNVLSINDDRYLNLADMQEFTKRLGLSTVPVIQMGYRLPESVKDLVSFSTDVSLLNGVVYREGLVFRPHVEQRDPRYGRVSFKVINPEFLLKYDE